jgi:hypothetical protein
LHCLFFVFLEEDLSFLSHDESLPPLGSIVECLPCLSIFDARYEIGTLLNMAMRKVLMVDEEVPDPDAKIDPWPGPLFDGDNVLPPQYKVVSVALETLESQRSRDDGIVYITGGKVYDRLGEEPWISDAWKLTSPKIKNSEKRQFREYQKAVFEGFMRNQGFSHLTFPFTTLSQLASELEKPENAAAKDEFERWEEAWCGRLDRYEEAADLRTSHQAALDSRSGRVNGMPLGPRLRNRLCRITRAYARLLLSTPNEPISDRLPPLTDPHDNTSPLLRTWHIEPHGRTIVMIGDDGGWEEAERYAKVLRGQGKGDGITVVTVPTTAPTFMVSGHRYCVLDLSDPSHSAFWYHEFNVLARKVWSFRIRRQIAVRLEVSHNRQVCYPLLRPCFVNWHGLRKCCFFFPLPSVLFYFRLPKLSSTWWT